MCGIAGIAHAGGTPAPAVIERMSALMAHRGPDQSGLYMPSAPTSAVTLATRRLAILDLSAEGSQPMTNETGDLWLAYNGEIYNHQQLRRELERRGHRYRSGTDTETVIHAYEEWGADAFRRFNGMFACALYDQRDERLILARDRRSIKPLYYVWDGESLAFASELKVLLGAGLARPETDPTALWLYLCLGYVPSPYTFVTGVRKLEPGHLLELHRGALRLTPFATPDHQPGALADEHEAVRAVREALEGAVRRQLMSDVPVGVFLSGGLDSTIVASLAARYQKDALHTFSVGYANERGEIEQSSYNDDFFTARAVARDLGTIHHEVTVHNNADLTGLFEQLVYQLDEPMVEPVFTATHVLSQAARSHGVPVVLTGDGADEIFGGYNRYFSARRLAMYRRLPGLRWALPIVESVGGSHEIAHSARELRHLLRSTSDIDGYIRFSSIYHPEQALRLLAPAARAEVDVTALSSIVRAALGPQAPFADQMAHADLVLWVGEHFNPRLDRISMLHSVEARVPFQDDEVVRVGLAIPSHLKSSSHNRKGLLKAAFADCVPARALTRPKRSFKAPGGDWLQGGLRAQLAELVAGDHHLVDLLDQDQVRHHAANMGADTPGQFFAAVALLAAELWTRQYVARDQLAARSLGMGR